MSWMSTRPFSLPRGGNRAARLLHSNTRLSLHSPPPASPSFSRLCSFSSPFSTSLRLARPSSGSASPASLNAHVSSSSTYASSSSRCLTSSSHCVSSVSPSPSSDRTVPVCQAEVLVVGAGLTGLTAAHTFFSRLPPSARKALQQRLLARGKELRNRDLSSPTHSPVPHVCSSPSFPSSSLSSSSSHRSSSPSSPSPASPSAASLTSSSSLMIVTDASGRAGGCLYTRKSPCGRFLFDVGANSFRLTRGTLKLVNDLGLLSQLQRADSRLERFVGFDGRLHSLPFSSLLALFSSSLLSRSGKLRLLAGLLGIFPPKFLWNLMNSSSSQKAALSSPPPSARCSSRSSPVFSSSSPSPPDPRNEEAASPTSVFSRSACSEREEETVEAFIARRLGPEVHRRILDALVTGICAGDASQLSMKATLPAAYAALDRGLVVYALESLAAKVASLWRRDMEENSKNGDTSRQACSRLNESETERETGRDGATGAGEKTSGDESEKKAQSMRADPQIAGGDMQGIANFDDGMEALINALVAKLPVSTPQDEDGVVDCSLRLQWRLRSLTCFRPDAGGTSTALDSSCDAAASSSSAASLASSGAHSPPSSLWFDALFETPEGLRRVQTPHVLLTIPPAAVASALSSCFSSSLLERLAALPHASMALVTIAYSKARLRHILWEAAKRESLLRTSDSGEENYVFLDEGDSPRTMERRVRDTRVTRQRDACPGISSFGCETQDPNPSVPKAACASRMPSSSSSPISTAFTGETQTAESSKRPGRVAGGGLQERQNAPSSSRVSQPLGSLEGGGRSCLGFGFLLSNEERIRHRWKTLGGIFVSDVFHGRVPESSDSIFRGAKDAETAAGHEEEENEAEGDVSLVTMFVGGIREGDAVIKEADEALGEAALEDFFRAFASLSRDGEAPRSLSTETKEKLRQCGTVLHVQRWVDTIPQYVTSHDRLKSDLKAEIAELFRARESEALDTQTDTTIEGKQHGAGQERLIVEGNWISGAAVGDRIDAGEKAGLRLTASAIRRGEFEP
ncbi:protoporphyrinogen oxidase [Toxoplasma gondii TgCatPRC2]|uniref:Protoporphyrinogen oxidase n=2 Tax=Toxoplasma gondii TaxID=5811 RepID=A0A151HPD7_TOXGO|nr:protoporphyrinogen oxidase [Toxoplasma gondii ARI]KYK71267.1 protoporphyrinogen oxidase [Toxoplasma gondii TgCatPRC2]